MRALELSTDEFRAAAARVSELAAEYLESLDARRTFPQVTGAEVESRFAQPLPEQGSGAAALDVLRDVMDCSRVQNGRFFGYVLGSGEPIGAVADLLASVLNQNVTAWRSGPAMVTIEKMVVNWLAEAIGCPGFTGSLCGGGSSANLMGLAMAREAMCPANDAGAQPAVVYASSEVHMSIPKAAALLGLGRQNLRLIPTGADFRMDVAALERAIEADIAAGRRPIAIVANAGTVTTGAVDPLQQIADVAQRFRLWLHVDGAYGALAAMARPGLFAGLERADSLSLDAHKWLYQPLDCGCLLFRDAAAARNAFSFSGDYARTLSADPIEGFAFFEATLELSRRARGLRLWLSLRYHGVSAFRTAVAQNIEQAKDLARLIAADSELELLAAGDLSAVCFRWIGQHTNGDLDEANRRILAAMIRRGRVYISNATIRGNFALRACIVNHRTTEADICAVIEEVKAAAAEIS